MRIIVADSCALIDLKKGGLLDIFLELPFELIVPDIILADELLSFTEVETASMQRKMTVGHLDGEQARQAEGIQGVNPALSLHDCAAFVLVQANPGAVLLTGDRRLRILAESAGVECHGVLWAVDEMVKAKPASRKLLIGALETWRDDVLVRLPAADLDRTLRRLRE